MWSSVCSLIHDTIILIVIIWVLLRSNELVWCLSWKSKQEVEYQTSVLLQTQTAPSSHASKSGWVAKVIILVAVSAQHARSSRPRNYYGARANCKTWSAATRKLCCSPSWYWDCARLGSLLLTPSEQLHLAGYMGLLPTRLQMSAGILRN